MASSHDSNPERRRRRSCHVYVQSPPPSSNDNDENTTTLQDLKFIKWNNTPPSSSSSQPTTTTVELTRPNTNLTKSYTVDGIFSSSFSSEKYYENYIQPNVKMALEENCNVLLWSFGTRGTGKTHVLFGSNSHKEDEEEEYSTSGGWIGNIASNINQQLLQKSPQSEKSKITVTVSPICVTADDVEQAFDCLCLSSSSSSSKPLSRIRQDPTTHEFHLETTNAVIVQSKSDINQLLQITRDFGIKEAVVGKRVHHLVTFTIYKMYDSGDVVRFTIQIMDVCGAERPSTGHTPSGNKKNAAASRGTAVTATTRRRRTTPPPATMQRKKEDKTLRALSRIMDSLSNQDKHIPYRDSKLTRLVSHSLGNNDRSINIALIGVSAMNESMYDETCAMMEFVSKVRSIEDKKTQGKSTTGKGGVVRTNRLQELQQAKQSVVTLSHKCGLDVDINGDDDEKKKKRLKSTDIELDMSSSMDLVDLRDALAQVELLEVDPMDALIEKSDKWWEDRRKG